VRLCQYLDGIHVSDKACMWLVLARDQIVCYTSSHYYPKVATSHPHHALQALRVRTTKNKDKQQHPAAQSVPGDVSEQYM
jgi:hypothetical protein